MMLALLFASCMTSPQSPDPVVGGYATDVRGKVFVIRDGSPRPIRYTVFLREGDEVRVEEGSAIVGNVGSRLTLLSSGESTIIREQSGRGVRREELDLLVGQVRRAAADFGNRVPLSHLPAGPFVFSIANSALTESPSLMRWLPVKGASAYTVRISGGGRDVWSARVLEPKLKVETSLPEGRYELTVSGWAADFRTLVGSSFRTSFRVLSRSETADIEVRLDRIRDMSIQDAKLPNLLLIPAYRETGQLAMALRLCSDAYNRSVEAGNPDPVLAAYVSDLLVRMGGDAKSDDSTRAIKAESQYLPFGSD
jgi:hypothetical protein